MLMCACIVTMIVMMQPKKDMFMWRYSRLKVSSYNVLYQILYWDIYRLLEWHFYWILHAAFTILILQLVGCEKDAGEESDMSGGQSSGSGCDNTSGVSSSDDR